MKMTKEMQEILEALTKTHLQAHALASNAAAMIVESEERVTNLTNMLNAYVCPNCGHK
jgi:hypothetical protein